MVSRTEKKKNKTNRFVNGINPSIAKLVYLTNFYGIETVLSHAGFYPGDPEEQEYWIQKLGYQENFGTEIHGPIVVIGAYWQLPYIIGMMFVDDIDTLQKELPQYWRVDHYNELPHLFEKNSLPIIISYKHPKFLQFQEIFNNLYLQIRNPVENYERRKYSQQEIVEFNTFIECELPLTNKEFNTIRNEGITRLEKYFWCQIQDFSTKKFKELVDHMTRSSNYYKMQYR